LFCVFKDLSMLLLKCFQMVNILSFLSQFTHCFMIWTSFSLKKLSWRHCKICDQYFYIIMDEFYNIIWNNIYKDLFHQKMKSQIDKTIEFKTKFWSKNILNQVSVTNELINHSIRKRLFIVSKQFCKFFLLWYQIANMYMKKWYNEPLLWRVRIKN
jgi:hypothetical protein